MNGSPQPAVTPAHRSLPRGRIRGAVCSSQGVRSGSRQAGPLQNRLHGGSAHALLVHSSWQEEVQLATPSLSPICPLSAPASLLLQEATSAFQ